MSLRKSLPLWVSVVLLSGCASIYSRNADPNAYAVPVTIVEKENVSVEAVGKGFFGTMSLTQGASATHIRYIVKDNKGRNSIVMSDSGSFEKGQCATLWRSSSNNNDIAISYPRLAPADKYCNVITPEPKEGEGYRYVGFLNGATYTGLDWNKKLFYSRYEFILDTWLDQPANNLIKAWGNPNSMTQIANGGTELQYTSGSRVTTTSTNGWGQVVDQYSNDYWCRTSFQVYNNVITSYSWNGNKCQ